MEQLPTDTTDYADIVLPVTIQLEHLDVIPSGSSLTGSGEVRATQEQRARS